MRQLISERNQDPITGTGKTRKIALEDSLLPTVDTHNWKLNNGCTIGWICDICTEDVSTQALMHDRLKHMSANDNNDYSFFKIGEHNVAIAFLPDGSYGTFSAAIIARYMLDSFPNVRIGQMIGIGDAPSPEDDVRLGDVLIISPQDVDGGVIQYDFWKIIQDQAVAKLLLNIGKINTDSNDTDRQMLLLWAAKKGHEAIFKLLFDISKVDANSKDEEGRTLLWWAARNGYGAVVKMLLDTGNVDPDSMDTNHQTPLWLAAGNGYNDIVKLLLDTGKVDADSKDIRNRTPLLWATQNGHVTVVKLLLDSGKVCADSMDKNHRTPLFLAARGGCDAIVKLLLDTGKVDTDLTDIHDRTSLWWATHNGHQVIEQVLLKQGARSVTNIYGLVELFTLL